MTRESKTTRMDCVVLTKYMHKLQEALMAYASSGMQKTGLNDDMFVKIEAINLRNYLEKFI